MNFNQAVLKNQLALKKAFLSKKILISRVNVKLVMEYMLIFRYPWQEKAPECSVIAGIGLAVRVTI
jgi:hypothetical protein